MTRTQKSKNTFKLLLLTAYLLLSSSCEELITPSELIVKNLVFAETYSNQYLNLPDSVFTPDNVDFDIDKPETWTGNMAQYINYNYMYKVSYQIKNIGKTAAYDSEIDLHYSLSNGEELIETIKHGEIAPGASTTNTISTTLKNQQLTEIYSEVFWID